MIITIESSASGTQWQIKKDGVALEGVPKDKATREQMAERVAHTRGMDLRAMHLRLEELEASQANALEWLLRDDVEPDSAAFKHGVEAQKAVEREWRTLHREYKLALQLADVEEIVIDGRPEYISNLNTHEIFDNSAEG